MATVTPYCRVNRADIRVAIFSCTKSFVATLLACALRDGRIAARRAVAYATSKAALVQLSRCAALDHAADGSRINALCLGDTDTPMLDASSGSQDRAAMLARLGADIPKGRVANPVEIAKAALFLASQQSSFVTGIALPVDGGASTG